MRKVYAIIFLSLFLSGCYQGGRVRLFNYNIWGGSIPSSVVVRKGDTLYSIARSYNVPIREMIEANHLQPPYTLKIGRQLKLPAARYHTVEKGDTLYNISRRYNVDITSLSRTNRIAAPYTLTVGQCLVLPGTVVDSSSYVPTSTYTPSKKWTPTPTSIKSKAPTHQTTRSSWKPQPKKTVTTTPAKHYSKAQTRYTTPPARRNSKFVWPTKGKVISPFGVIGKGRNNDGINIQASRGSMVRAADKGTIAYAGNELKGFGNLILIRHYDGWITAYAHNEKLLVKKGQRVSRGEKIATVGSSGGVRTPQLHFEIRRGKKPVDPRRYLP